MMSSHILFCQTNSLKSKIFSVRERKELYLQNVETSYVQMAF